MHSLSLYASICDEEDRRSDYYDSFIELESTLNFSEFPTSKSNDFVCDQKYSGKSKSFENHEKFQKS